MTSSTGNSLSGPPRYNEVEVSIFGPGYGESVLVHLGQHDWLIVDSCLNQTSKQPASIEYLHSIGVNPSATVKLVVATHWHDDHVRGLGSVFRECEAAQFVCSDALRSQEFLTLVEASGTWSMMTSSGVQEFSEVLDVLWERRQNSSRWGSIGPVWAIANRLLWQRPSSDGLPGEVYALSPSDVAVTLAHHEIARLLPQEGTPKRRVIAQPPNHVAVVLWVKIGKVAILLGSDLEETHNFGTGWSVIVDSATRPSERASVFKVPHHGSVPADQPRVWSEMLKPDPVAALTPFVQGKITLPTRNDIGRICIQTTKAYATATTRPKQSQRRSGVVDKTIRETVRSIRDAHSPAGHIRLRRNALEPAEGGWKVELFGAALPLREMYAVR